MELRDLREYSEELNKLLGEMRIIARRISRFSPLLSERDICGVRAMALFFADLLYQEIMRVTAFTLHGEQKRAAEDFLTPEWDAIVLGLDPTFNTYLDYMREYHAKSQSVVAVGGV